MSWRTVVITGRAKLDLKLGYLVIRKEETVKIHLSEIAVLIIESTAVSLTAALLCEVTKKKIKVIFCDERRNPHSELVPLYGSVDTSSKVKSQAVWTEKIKEAVWTEIIKEKIKQQMQVLIDYDCPEYSMLEGYINEIQPGDKTNREGHAAKVYFNALFGMDFTRTTDCVLNAALNYGYSVLLSAFNRAVASSGYITQLGLFHCNTYNYFNLSSDLMEPFRPLIDRAVYELNPEKLDREEKNFIVNVLKESIQSSVNF